MDTESMIIGFVGVVIGIVSILLWLKTKDLIFSVKYDIRAMNDKIAKAEKVEAILTQKTDFTIDELFESIKNSHVLRERIAQGLEENTYTIDGNDAVYQKAFSMLKGSKSSILSIWCLPSEEPPSWYSETIEQKIKDGVQIIRLVNLNVPQIKAYALEVMKNRLQYKNFEMYHTDQTSSETMIVDDAAAIVTFPTAGHVTEITSAIYTDNPKFVTAIKTWYQRYMYSDKTRIRTAEDIMKFGTDDAGEKAQAAGAQAASQPAAAKQQQQGAYMPGIQAGQSSSAENKQWQRPSS